MSMWLNFVKVSPETYQAIKAKPTLIEPIFFDSELEQPAGIEEGDYWGEDYRTIAACVTGATGQDFFEIEHPIGDATGDDGEDIEYSFCYGNAFGFPLEKVKELSKKLKGLEEDVMGIGEFFTEAAKEGKAIIGGVS